MADTLSSLRLALAGRYAVERELGRGGMAAVFLAGDERHGRSVAIKVLDPDLARAVGAERFRREVEIAARLTHPNIVPLLDSGDADGLLYYVMPYIEGESLRSRLARERQLSEDEAVRLACEVASGLDYAHRQGVIHRDIKPENILLADDHAMIADFGIGRAIAAGADRLTETGITVGTPAYMSPEQAMGSRALDGRSDLYSLACVLYEMLAGQPPFTAPTPQAIAFQHSHATPRSLSDLGRALDPSMERAVLRGLAKNPADRFATGADVIHALSGSAKSPRPVPGSVSEFAQTQAMAFGIEAADPPKQVARTHRRASVMMLFASIGVIALGAAAWWLWGRHQTPKLAPAGAWLLAADFQGPAEEEEAVRAVRALALACMQQSRSVRVVTDAQIRIAMGLAKLPAGAAVTSVAARELAYRSNFPFVLEGELARLGESYTLVMKITDSDSGAVLAVASGTSRRSEDLVPTVDALVRRLLGSLGEPAALWQKWYPAGEIVTPSFEAFRALRAATRAGDWGEKRTHVGRALELDPEFASAWVGLGTLFYNLGQPDSALVAYGNALRFKERLLPYQREALQGRIARIRGDLHAALLHAQAVLAERPNDGGSVFAVAFVHAKLGEFARSMQEYEQNWKLDRFPEQGPLALNMTVVAASMGKLDVARRYSELSAIEELRLVSQISLEVAAHDWERLDSLGRELDSRTELTGVYHWYANRALAAAWIANGELARGTGRLDEVGANTYPEGAPEAESARDMLLLAGLYSGELPRAAVIEQGATGAVRRGILSCLAGDFVKARKELASAPPMPSYWLGPESTNHLVLRSLLGIHEGRARQVVDELAPIGRRSLDITTDGQGGLGVVAVRWLTASAFERAGQPDSAVVYLERALDDPGSLSDVELYGAVAFPFLHSRLVHLHAQLGHDEEARTHLEALRRSCTRPDPTTQRLIAAAEHAVASELQPAPSTVHRN